MSLAMMDRRGTLMVIDNDPVGSEAELKRSLGYQLRAKIEAVEKNADKGKLDLRLISIKSSFSNWRV